LLCRFLLRSVFSCLASATTDFSTLSLTTLFRSGRDILLDHDGAVADQARVWPRLGLRAPLGAPAQELPRAHLRPGRRRRRPGRRDRKSTRLNSSHEWTSYAVFCSTKKTENAHMH